MIDIVDARCTLEVGILNFFVFIFFCRIFGRGSWGCDQASDWSISLRPDTGSSLGSKNKNPIPPHTRKSQEESDVILCVLKKIRPNFQQSSVLPENSYQIFFD